jgi:hypothetical protein
MPQCEYEVASLDEFTDDGMRVVEIDGPQILLILEGEFLAHYGKDGVVAAACGFEGSWDSGHTALPVPFPADTRSAHIYRSSGHCCDDFCAARGVGSVFSVMSAREVYPAASSSKASATASSLTKLATRR